MSEKYNVENDIFNDLNNEPKHEITAADIQKQRQEISSKITRRKNLANTSVDKDNRQAIIRTIIDNDDSEKITPTQVQEALKEKGVDISLVTVCKDLDEIKNISPQTMKKIDSAIVGKLRDYLTTLENIAETSEDDDTKIRAINACFDDTRKMYEILDTIATRTILQQTEKAKLGMLTNPVQEVIQFIDSPERVDKVKYYDIEKALVVDWILTRLKDIELIKRPEYEAFSTPFAVNTFNATIIIIKDMLAELENNPHRPEVVQQEKVDSEEIIKKNE